MSEIWRMIGCLGLAAVLGGIVGWEREVHERPAGLRTHILVSMGSALITLISVSFTTPYDPGRIAAQIVSGIGFLGAGTILRQGNIVRGLTTAASLWTVAGIGMAVGVGGKFAILAIVATLIVFLTLSTMSRIEAGLGKRDVHRLAVDICGDRVETLSRLLNELAMLGIALKSAVCVRRALDEKDISTVELGLYISRRMKLEAVTEILSKEANIVRFEWL